MLPKLFHPFIVSLRVSPVTVERSRIVPLSPSQTMARFRPSGDKLQLHDGSICSGSECLPVLTSKRNVSVVSPLIVLYMQIAEGKGEHCTFQIPTSRRIRRGVPPAIGIAKMELGVLRSADLGVEIYKISEPSGVIQPIPRVRRLGEARVLPDSGGNAIQRLAPCWFSESPRV
jgi:hypothetical protein